MGLCVSLCSRRSSLCALCVNFSFPTVGGYNVSMRFAAWQILLRSTASLLTLCLLIAPLCATRCSLASCLPSSAPQQSEGGCHHAAAKSHAALALAALPAISCQTTDALLAARPAHQTRSLPSTLNKGTRALSSALISSVTQAPDLAITLRASRQDSSPGSYSFHSSVAPLRI